MTGLIFSAKPPAKLFWRESHNLDKSFPARADIVITSLIRYPFKGMLGTFQVITRFLYSETLQILIRINPGCLKETALHCTYPRVYL